MLIKPWWVWVARNFEWDLPQKVFGRLSVDWWSFVGRKLAVCWLTLYRQFFLGSCCLFELLLLFCQLPGERLSFPFAFFCGGCYTVYEALWNWSVLRYQRKLSELGNCNVDGSPWHTPRLLFSQWKMKWVFELSGNGTNKLQLQAFYMLSWIKIS